MNLRTQIEDAITNIFAAKMRSLLAVLGILVGTASVVAMILGGELATRQALLQFKALGTDLLSISISQEITNNSNKTQQQIEPDDVFALQKEASNDIIDIAPYTNSYADIKFASKKIDGGSIIGASENLFTIAKIKLLAGRYIYYIDDTASFCVIGKKIYEQLKQYSINPIGQQIFLGKNIFTIVGVLDTAIDNSFIFINTDSSIFIPIKKTAIFNKNYFVNNIVLKLREDTDINIVEKKIENYFAKDYASSKLYMRSAEQFIQGLSKEKEILTVFLGFIGGISLLVGGIGVMNIMLVSVTERRREIGIRLAIGAKRADIKSLFLVESITLSLFGGLMGVFLGTLIAFIIALFKQWEFTLFLMPPVLGFSVSVLVGVFFGFYPALKASKLSPIETLRTE